MIPLPSTIMDYKCVTSVDVVPMPSLILSWGVVGKMK